MDLTKELETRGLKSFETFKFDSNYLCGVSLRNKSLIKTKTSEPIEEVFDSKSGRTKIKDLSDLIPNIDRQVILGGACALAYYGYVIAYFDFDTLDVNLLFIGHGYNRVSYIEYEERHYTQIEQGYINYSMLLTNLTKREIEIIDEDISNKFKFELIGLLANKMSSLLSNTVSNTATTLADAELAFEEVDNICGYEDFFLSELLDGYRVGGVPKVTNGIRTSGSKEVTLGMDLKFRYKLINMLGLVDRNLFLHFCHGNKLEPTVDYSNLSSYIYYLYGSKLNTGMARILEIDCSKCYLNDIDINIAFYDRIYEDEIRYHIYADTWNETRGVNIQYMVTDVYEELISLTLKNNKTFLKLLKADSIKRIKTEKDMTRDQVRCIVHQAYVTNMLTYRYMSDIIK